MHRIAWQLAPLLVVACTIASAVELDLGPEFDRVYSTFDISGLDADRTGRRVAFAKQSHHWAIDKISTLGVLDTLSGNVTWAGDEGSHRPRLSPDGAQLAFVRAGSSKESSEQSGNGIAILSIEDRSQSEIVPTGAWTAVELAWSPDAKRIAYVAKSLATQAVQQFHEDRHAARSERVNGPIITVAGADAESISQMPPKEMGALFVLDVVSRRVERLTPESLNVDIYTGTIDWSPDGKKLAFTARPASTPFVGNFLDANDVYWIEVKTHTLSDPIGGALADQHPRWSPDGSRLAMKSFKGASSYAWETQLLIHDLREGRSRALEFVEFRIDDRDAPNWYRDGRSIWMKVAHTSRVSLARVDTQSGRVLEVIELESTPRSLVLTSNGRVFMAASTATKPSEIYEVRKGRASQRSRVNVESFPGKAERVSWTSEDGLATDGILITPDRPGLRPPFPTVVHVHGGPGGVYFNSFSNANAENTFGPAAVYVSKGYAVFMPNTRAAETAPTSHRQAFRYHWGDEYKLDVDTGINALVGRGIVDPERLALVGHSYGGYLTAMAVTQTTRFKAALFSDGMVNLLVDDLELPDFQEYYSYYFGGTYAERRRALIERSPVMALDRVRTPILVRAGNLRVGDRTYGKANQARQLYTALRVHNVPSKLLLHNYEGHGIGDPMTYRDYTRRNLAWLDYYVLGQGADPMRVNEATER